MSKSKKTRKLFMLRMESSILFKPLYLRQYCPFPNMHRTLQMELVQNLQDTTRCMKLCRCVSSSCICVSVSEPPGLRCECSSSSEPPQPPHQTVIRVKPAASPTEAGGTDLPSSAFHLCLNATRLKHTHKALLLRFSSVFSVLNPVLG